MRSTRESGSSWKYLATALSCLVVVAGCKSLDPIQKPQQGTTEGLILVDSPEVFGRERLIVDRELQKKWLKTQLEIDDEAFDAVQAALLSRSLERSSLSLGVDATPSAGLEVRQAEAEAENLGRQQEIADLEHQIRLAQLQNDLARAQAGEEVSSSSSTTGNTGGASSGSDSTGSTGSGGTASSASDSGGTGGTGSASSTGSTSSSGSSASGAASGAQLPSLSLSAALKDTPTDRFRDHLAYREAVRQELLENDLDDAHDLSGNTLYRWTFDTTLLPAHDTSAWGMVRVVIEEPVLNCNMLQADQFRTFKVWAVEFLDKLEDSMRFEADALQKAYLDENPSRDPLIGALVRAQGSDPDREFRKQYRGEMARPDGALALETVMKNRAACTVAAQYRRLLMATGLEENLTFFPPGEKCEETEGEDGDFDYSLDVNWSDSEKDVRGFCDLVATLKQRVEPYAVTPKESVERVADSAVARFEEERALSAALSAGTVGLESALDYLRASENQRQAVRRLPLVVGFSEKRKDSSGESAEVGWLLGPRLYPRHIDPGYDFRHRPVQLPLSAVVSVPSWWTSVDLKVHGCWRKEEATDPLSTCGANPTSLSIRLPGDPSEVVRALFPRTRRPEPFVYDGGHLEIGRKEKVVIFGENLWRNPQVFLGGQPADDVEIMPDMKGILATFSKVLQPPNWTPSQPFGQADLWVWTSEGNAPAGYVHLHKPKTPPSRSAPKVGFTVESNAPHVAPDSKNEGVLGLVFKFEKKKDSQGRETNIVDKVFLEIEGAVADASRTAAPCLNTGTVPWEVSDSCRFQVQLQSLVVGKVVTVKASRKENTKTIAHAPIGIEVRK